MIETETPIQEIFRNPRTPRERAILRVTWAGLVLNVLLSGGKLLGGFVGNSQAVVADAVHSLSDTVSDVAILVGLKYWSAPADSCHPYGHGRVETVVTVFIASLLAATGLGLGYNALATLGREDEPMRGWTPFWAATASIITKEIFFRWTTLVGHRQKSKALIANAWHHRSDALSSIPAAIATAGAAFNPNWAFLDHIGAVVVCGFIFRAAWNIGKPALNELIDAAAPREEIREIERVAANSDGVMEVHAVRTRNIGAGLQVDLHILVDGTLTVQEGHKLAEQAKTRILEDENLQVVDVITHLEPWDKSEAHKTADNAPPPEAR